VRELHLEPRPTLLLRPDDVLHDDAKPLQANVLHKAFRGAEFLYTLELQSGSRILSLVPSHHNHAVGTSIGIRLEVDHSSRFRVRNGERRKQFNRRLRSQSILESAERG